MGEMSFLGAYGEKISGLSRLTDQSINQVHLTAAVWITSASRRCSVNIQDLMYLQPENRAGWRNAAYKETFWFVVESIRTATLLFIPHRQILLSHSAVPR